MFLFWIKPAIWVLRNIYANTGLTENTHKKQWKNLKCLSLFDFDSSLYKMHWLIFKS